MNMWRLLAAAMVIVVSALVTMAGPLQAQPFSGNGDYQVYCASCHGADAKGEGVIAKSLKKHPADLTQLSKRNDDVFPAERVFKTINGAEPGGAHGGSAMPSWGDVFAKATESAGADKAALRIDALVKYLESLQAK